MDKISISTMSDFSSPNGLNSKVCFKGPSTSYEEENELLLIEITKSRGAEVFLHKVKKLNIRLRI